MTKFVNRGGHMVSLERAALIDAANGDLSAIPTPAPAPVAEPVETEPRSQAAAALSAGQKAAITRAANKAARDTALLAARAEPLRPRNVDADGNEVVLKEVIEDGEVKQVQVETETAEVKGGEPTLTEDAFDAAVEAAAAAKTPEAPAEEDEAAALADA